jgi:TolB-like protein
VQQQLQPAVKLPRKTARLPVLIGVGIASVVLIVLGYLFLSPKPTALSEKSIAVLPFVDMSPQKDQEYFCDGMTEEIITDLSHVHEVLVISRSSAMTFKGTKKTIPEIARAVNVRYVLEGSVRKAGNRIRVTAQLVKASDGYHLWSQRFDRALELNAV